MKKKSQPPSKMLHDLSSFERIKFKNEAQTLLDMFGAYGDLSTLSATERGHIDHLIQSSMVESVDSKQHRALMLETILNSVKSAETKEIKGIKKRFGNLGLGFSYLQKKLNFKLSELKGYTDTHYQHVSNNQKNNFLHRSNPDTDKILMFMLTYFSDKKDTTDFILSCVNQCSVKCEGFVKFLTKPENQEVIKNNLVLTNDQEESLFELCLDEILGEAKYSFLELTDKGYNRFDGYTLLSGSRPQKSLKNKLILDALDLDISNTYYYEKSHFDEDAQSAQSLLNFLSKASNKNTHTLIEGEKITKIVEFYLIRNAMHLNHWKNNPDVLALLPDILQTNDRIEKTLFSIIHLFDGKKDIQNVEDIKKSINIKHFDFIKSQYRLTQKPTEIRAEFLNGDMKSILAQHCCQNLKPNDPQFLVLEKLTLQSEMMASDQNKMTKKVKTGHYKV